VPPRTPPEADVGDVFFFESRPPLVDRNLPRGDFSLGLHKAREYRRQDEQVDQLRIKGCFAFLHDDVARDFDRPALSVAAMECDGVEGVGDRHDAGGQRDSFALELTGIARAIPPLVVMEHAASELGIEAVEWREDVSAPLWVGEDRAPFGVRQLTVVVNDVEQRFVDLADVVK